MADLSAKLAAQRKAEAESKDNKADAEGDVDLD